MSLKRNVQFLGHTKDSEGIHPTYLGVINYDGKFIPIISCELNALYDLSREGTEFKWTTECESDFQRYKNLLVSKQVLVHYV